MAGRRLESVDALRALALFGILQVNIQSFLHGAGDPLGYFLTPPRPIDTAVYLVGQDGRREARRHYRRRLLFLLGVGVAHGTLLYYGDILTAYALAGFVLVLYADARPARLARAARNFFIGHAAILLALVGLTEWARRSLPPDFDVSQVPPGVIETFEVMVTGTWLEQLPLRVEHYLALQGTTLVTGMPFILGLFTLGALAGRLGWLAHPGRHRRLWRAAVPLGAAGLAFSAAGTWLNYRTMVDTPGDPALWGFLLMGFGFAATALYLAWFVAQRDAPWMRRVIAWLAPAGRMPLTNYLMQAVILGALLTGWGLGWGAHLGRAELALLALAIVAVQIVVSRWWIGCVGQGPIEALWRRVTY